jgi:hypothetical protein
MTKTMILLEFLKSPKSLDEMRTHFGVNVNSLLRNLKKAGSVKKISVANENSGKKWARVVATKYVATGVEYKVRMVGDHLKRKLKAMGEPE